MDFISEALIVVVLASAVAAPCLWLYRRRDRAETKWVLLAVCGTPAVLIGTLYFIGPPLLLIVLAASAVAARRGMAGYVLPVLVSLPVALMLIWITAGVFTEDMRADDWFGGVLLAMSIESALLCAVKLGEMVGRRRNADPGLVAGMR